MLREKNSYDVALVRIKAVDEFDNVLPFYNDSIILETKGQIELIGPSVISLSGGMGGAYIKTVGKSGKGSLIIKMINGENQTVEFAIE